MKLSKFRLAGYLMLALSWCSSAFASSGLSSAGIAAMGAAAAAANGGAKSHRVALVIGNGSYPSAPLTNPVNDARAVASALRTVGFQVIKLEDVGKKAMKQAMRQMSDTLRDTNGVGLFYFAGHGIQVDGNNYVLPVDQEFFRPSHVRTRALDLNWVLDEMEQAGNGVKIVILDACRNNPIVSSVRSARRELAPMQPPTGTYIAFATASEGVALDGSSDSNHSVYTKHLVNHLTRPGLTIEQLFKQVRIGVLEDTDGSQKTIDRSMLTGEFYFAGGDRVATDRQLPATRQDAAARDRAAQLAMWDTARQQQDPALYQAYLNAYPDGIYAGLATLLLQRVEQVSPSVAAAPVTVAKAPGVGVKQRSYSAPAKTHPTGTAGLLAKGRQALAENRLLVPANDSAMLWANKVLKRDPNNSQAHALTNQVVARYLLLSKRALATNQIGKASKYIERTMTLQKYASQDQIKVMADLMQKISSRRVALAKAPRTKSPGAGQPAAGQQQPPGGHRESTTAENIAAFGTLFKGLGEGIGSGARAFILPF